MEHKILLIEDERGLRVTVSDRLHKEGYKIEAASDGEAGFNQAAGGDFDLIILDLMLPKKSGFDVCRDLRQLGVATPILMLTARDQMVDKVVGLKIGADDYVTKPFDMPELLARVEALLRRTARPLAETPAAYQFGSIRVDFRKTEVLRQGKVVPLSAKEFQLLRYFIENRGATLTREKLLQEVWGYNSIPLTRTVDVHIAWLRQKLEDDPKQPQWIVTVHRFGYRFTG
jgi:two-component system alkaline phosphatase synthesis response regulator PhoP